MKTTTITFLAIAVCIVANVWCAPTEIIPKIARLPAPSKLPESAYEPFTKPTTDDVFLSPKKPFRDPLASQTEKIDRAYLLEMCKSLIIQGYLPYVVMDDLKKMNEKTLIDKAIRGHSTAAARSPLFGKFRRVIINQLTSARENLNQESHEESSELWQLFVDNERDEDEEQ